MHDCPANRFVNISCYVLAKNGSFSMVKPWIVKEHKLTIHGKTKPKAKEFSYLLERLLYSILFLTCIIQCDLNVTMEL